MWGVLFAIAVATSFFHTKLLKVMIMKNSGNFPHTFWFVVTIDCSTTLQNPIEGQTKLQLL